jgi:PadR family transcriptional regulator PadR
MVFGIIPECRSASVRNKRSTSPESPLKAVSLRPQHGYGVLLRIEQIAGGALSIEQGALYPALYRLEHQGALACEWGISENNRRAKYYTLTPSGRKRLGDEVESIEQDHRAVKRRVNAKQGFRSFDGACRTIQGYEVMHMIRKGQVRWLPKGGCSRAGAVHSSDPRAESRINETD